ncbi:MAG: 23S rRNA (adenine(2030)-N(6))-methyltransferase RlmJ [Caulobacteraceae bacterium]
MNYRHAFHAGNFADLLKHAVLTVLLREATADCFATAPLTVIDTHAGAGRYDLGGKAARRTGEAAIGALMRAPDAPPAFDALRAAVHRLNPDGGWRFYPGSPRLIADQLRPGDRLVACEMRADDHAALGSILPKARVLRGDGWRLGLDNLPAAPAPALALIDPPYEAPGDGMRAAAFVRAALRRNPRAVISLWAPIKDLTGFDALRSRLAEAGRYTLVECRLHPLDDPMRLNGCAMAVFNVPTGLDDTFSATAAWIVGDLGEAGAASHVGHY